MSKTLQDKINQGFQFYSAEEVKDGSYIKIPKQFYSCPFYREFLNSTSRELYGFLKDRMGLSLKEENIKKFTDENGLIYLVYTRDDVMELFGISKGTCTAAFQDLVKTGLIYEKRQGQGKNNLIYIGKIRYMQYDKAISLIEEIKKTEPTEKVGTSSVGQKSKKQTSKKQTSRSSKNRLPEVQKIDGNNTDSNKTDFNKTNSEEEEVKQSTDNVDNFKTDYMNQIKPYVYYSACKGNGYQATEIEKNKIADLVKLYSVEIVIKAIEEMSLRAKTPNLKYVINTLKDWSNRGLTTLEKVNLSMAEHDADNKKATENNNKKKKAAAENKPFYGKEKKGSWNDNCISRNYTPEMLKAMENGEFISMYGDEMEVDT